MAARLRLSWPIRPAKDADIPTITLAPGDTFEKTQEGVLVAQVGEDEIHLYR